MGQEVQQRSRRATGWFPLSPIAGHGLEADLDVSGLEYAAKFVIAADVDGDGRQELVIVPDVAGSAGNDLSVRKFNNDPAAPGWFPLSPIAGHGLEADLDVSGLEYAAKFVIAADVDGDGRQELVIVPDVAGSAGNDLWVRKFNNDPAAPGWFPLSPIAGHGLEADLDVSGLEYAAKFVIAADVDGDGRQELVIVPDVAGSAGNDLWVRKFNDDPAAPGWFPLSPIFGLRPAVDPREGCPVRRDAPDRCSES